MTNHPFPGSLPPLALVSALLLSASGARAASAALDAPVLTVQRDGAQLVLTYSGALLSAASPSGPWTPVAGATSPHRWSLESSERQFFKAGATSGTGVFDSQEITSWMLTGPLQHHFELAHAGMPDGIFPPVREKPYFNGTVTVGPTTVPAQIRVRGNSSLQECPFPKLKIKVARADRTNTPFAEAREIKIGSHCADGGRGPIGRLREESACYREALAYETAGVLGFTLPRVRRAVVDYRDTSTPAGPDSPVGWQLRRKALLIEDPEVVGERLGGRALDDAEIDALTNANFPPTLILELQMLHILLGNWDYALSIDGTELWNTDVIALENGLMTPMPGDFDLASFVTGEVRLEAPHDYRPDLPDLDRQVRFKLEQLRSLTKPDIFGGAAVRFLNHRHALAELLESADLDAEGRANAQHHLAAFFAVLDDLVR